MTDLSDDEQIFTYLHVDYILKQIAPFCRCELFRLQKINGTEGYLKSVYEGLINSVEFKCLDNYMLPFVIRKFLGGEITENDKVFYHEGLLSKFIEVPNIEI